MNFNKVPSTKCSECGFDANTATANQCAVCNYPLRGKDAPVKGKNAFIGKGALSRGGKSISRRQGPSLLGWIALALPPLLIAAGYLIGSNPRVFKTSSSAPAPSSISQSPEIQLYDSMQEVQNVPKGLFSHGGALQFAALVSNGMNQAINQAYPGFQLRYTEPLNRKPGSSTGIAMLLDSQLSFAQSGRPLEDAEYSKSKSRGFALEQVPVAIDGTVFYTHPNIKLPGLSVDQLQAIYTGKVTNWKQVGGPNLPIVPMALDLQVSSALKALLEGLEGAKVGKNVQIARDFTTLIRQTASTPGGISYGSASIVINQKSVRPLAVAKTGSKQYVSFSSEGKEGKKVNTKAFQDGTYPLTRRLFVIVRRDGTFDEQAGVAYANLLLSNEGQQIIEKSGFVAIRR
jgi:ABC-type phosphate transport system substrate-binding protein/ribosomal protein L37E